MPQIRPTIREESPFGVCRKGFDVNFNGLKVKVITISNFQERRGRCEKQWRTNAASGSFTNADQSSCLLSVPGYSRDVNCEDGTRTLASLGPLTNGVKLIEPYATVARHLQRASRPKNLPSVLATIRVSCAIFLGRNCDAVFLHRE